MTRNPIQALFDWKVRGVRWIEIILLVVVAALVLSVYVAKAGAARESVRISQLEREIAETRQRVRLLRAEAARLEQPARLEVLSRSAGLAPVEMKHQADESALDSLVPLPEPAPVPAAEPSPEAASADVASAEIGGPVVVPATTAPAEESVR